MKKAMMMLAMLALPFVYPSLERCLGDVEDEKPAAAAKDEEEKQQ